jgi:hypothetical protein
MMYGRGEKGRFALIGFTLFQGIQNEKTRDFYRRALHF